MADPPEERTVNVFLGFQLNNKDMEGTLVVVVDFSLALNLSEINNCYTMAHLDHHLLVESCCKKKNYKTMLH